MSKKKLAIFPFNGNGIEALDAVDPSEYEFVGFIDDDKNKKSAIYKLISRDRLLEEKDIFVLGVPGSVNNFKIRHEIIASLNLDPQRFVSIIHPSAAIGRNVKVGINCLFMAGVVITSNAQIGNHVIILPNTVVHHDSEISDYVVLGSGIVVAGGVRIERNCYIGSGSNVINQVTVGSYSLIGLGTNVTRSVQANSKMVGNPAKNLNA